MEGSQLSINDVGLAADGPGNLIIRNHATGAATNFHVVGVQDIGPIITTTGTITNVNPWATSSSDSGLRLSPAFPLSSAHRPGSGGLTFGLNAKWKP